jgi:hypothetical protein
MRHVRVQPALPQALGRCYETAPTLLICPRAKAKVTHLEWKSPGLEIGAIELQQLRTAALVKP